MGTGKYWLAGNPNAEITDAEVTKLGQLTSTELELLDASAVTPSDGPWASVARWAKATYDFAEHGGAVSAIGLGVTIPDNAIILDGFVEILTTCQTESTDSGTGALSVEGANDLRTATAVSSGTFWDAGIKAIVPVGTVATYIKTTADKEITFTIAGQAFTAGKFNVWLQYVIGG